MSRARLLFCALCAGSIALVAGLLTADRSHAAGSAAAQTPAARTFVSTSGSDANPCTNTQPCRNFAAALANTAPGGEVVALSSGGYGPVTIAMSVTIVGSPGIHAAITATSGNAITVNAGASDTVVLRNLSLNGLGGGSHGIFFQAARALHVEGLVITGFTGSISDGIAHNAANGRLVVTDTILRGNQYGINGWSGASGSTATATLERVRADDNTYGIATTWLASAHISDSVFSRNANDGIIAHGVVNIVGTRMAQNGRYGLWVNTGTTRLSSSSAVLNGTTGIRVSATLESLGDNVVRGNTLNVDGAVTAVGKT